MDVSSLKLAEFEELYQIADRQEQAVAASALARRSQVIFVRDGSIEISRVQDIVSVEVNGGQVTVDGEVSIARR